MVAVKNMTFTELNEQCIVRDILTAVTLGEASNEQRADVSLPILQKCLTYRLQTVSAESHSLASTG